MDAKTFASEYYSYLWQSKNVNDPHVSFTTEAFGVKTGREHCVPKVPVRRRGPWHGDGTDWEDWHDGVYHMRNLDGRPYRVKNGVLEYLSFNNEWCKKCTIDGLNGVELRAPKGYDGPVPEGCRWADETLYRCRSCGRLYSDLERKSLIAGKCVCSGPPPFIKIVQTPAVAHEFDVGDRVRVAPGGRSGTVVCVVSTSVLRVRWDETGVENTLHPDVVSIVPASEDPLPRKEGVIVYAVTAEEFNEGQHPSAHHRYVHEGYWSARGVGVRGGRIHWGSLRDLLSDAKSGETWIVCRE